MATEDNSRSRQPTQVRPAAAMEPIRVKSLRSSGPAVALPPPARGGMLNAGERPTGETITIQYEPWQRHHRVRALDHEGKVSLEVCIPESWVAYTPASEEA